MSLHEHVLAAGPSRAVTVTWRKGSKATMASRFVFLRVRLAGRNREIARWRTILLVGYRPAQPEPPDADVHQAD